MKSAVTLREFSFRYSSDDAWALSNLSLSVPERSCCAVLGATSSGKSTLLHALSGLLGRYHRDADVKGAITVDSIEKSAAIPTDVLFPTVGLVLQDPHVMITGMHETVREEVGFTLQNLGYSTPDIELKVQNVLRLLHLENLALRHPLQLSGGEVQRVALATVLVAEPKIMLMDEPRNSLDCEGQDTLVRIVRDLRSKQTIIFADNQVDLALCVADYILVLHEGRGLFFGEKATFAKQFHEFTPLLFTREWSEVLQQVNNENRGGPEIQRVKRMVGL